MKYIGLISDTHGVFDTPFREFFAPVDEVWHAGDFGGGMELAEQIATYKPLIGVAGNCDKYNSFRCFRRYRNKAERPHSCITDGCKGYG